MNRKADVVVMTVIQTEMDAINDYGFEIIHDATGQPCFLGSFHNEKIGRDLTVVHYNIGLPGSAPAAVTATNAIQNWSPSFIVLLGIAAGISQRGVKIGDVIIADRTQYISFGKTTKEGFLRRPIGMFFDHTISENMRLHNVDWDKMGTQEIRKTIGNPRTHFGLVLSGEEVIDSSKRLEELLEQFGDALGIEMEARGFYEAAHRNRVPAIMLRGVSDIADGTKNDDFQSYASVVASEFLVSFLQDCDYSRIVDEDIRPPTDVLKGSRPSEVPKDIQNEMLDLIEDTIGLPRTSDWEKNITLLVGKLNNDPLEIDYLVRYGLFTLLEESFKQRNPHKTSAVLLGVQASLTILRELEREDIFSNWFASYRAFYNDFLTRFLQAPDHRRYDENTFWEVREFAKIVGLTLEHSLVCGDDPYFFFSYSFGIDLTIRMILEGLRNPREYYVAEDDHAHPSTHSVVVQPLMQGLVKSAEILIEKKDTFSQGYINFFLRRITRAAFAVLHDYRDQDNLDDINRIGLHRLFSEPQIINQNEFVQQWTKLFEFNEPRGYLGIIKTVSDSIELDGHLMIDQEQLLWLFFSSLDAYKIQIRVYEKVAHSLMKLCVKCIDYYEPEESGPKRLILGMNISDEIMSVDLERLNYLDIVDAMSILGWLSDPSNIIPEVVRKLEDIWLKTKRWRPQIIDYLLRVVKWQSDQAMMPEPDEWIREGGKVVLKVIKSFPKG